MAQNVTEKRKLTPAQQRAIGAMLAGANGDEAAAAAGVARRTIVRWNEQPEFIAELERHAGDAVAAATRRLALSLDCAIDTMHELMKDATQPASVRLRAANYIVTHAQRLIEQHEILQRLDELEQALHLAR